MKKMVSVDLLLIEFDGCASLLLVLDIFALG